MSWHKYQSPMVDLATARRTMPTRSNALAFRIDLTISKSHFKALLELRWHVTRHTNGFVDKKRNNDLAISTSAVVEGHMDSFGTDPTTSKGSQSARRAPCLTPAATRTPLSAGSNGSPSAVPARKPD